MKRKIKALLLITAIVAIFSISIHACCTCTMCHVKQNNQHPVVQQ